MVDEEAAISGDKVSMGDRKVLSVYFTRVGNTDFDKDVNAVSGALAFGYLQRIQKEV